MTSLQPTLKIFIQDEWVSGSLNEEDHLWGRKFSLISNVFDLEMGGQALFC